MDNKDPFMLNILDTFNLVTSKPETFISSQEKFGNDVRYLLKNTYDFTKKEESKPCKSDALPELIIQNFDLEQIWQQLELQNDQILEKSIANVSKLAVAKDRLLFDDIANELFSDDDSSSDSEENSSSNKPLLQDSKGDSNDEELELQEDSNDENSDMFSDENDVPDESNRNDSANVRKKFKPSILDDEFFKLDEMNNFLATEEKKFNNVKNSTNTDSESEEDSLNMFKAESENEEEVEDNFEGNDKEKNPRYKDFFRAENTNWMEEQIGNGDADEDDNHKEDAYEDNNDKEKAYEDDGEAVVNDAQGDDGNTNQKSALELRQERLKMKIQEIENAAISEKPWQLKGEITAESRPQNSLLEEVLEFDLVSRPAPVITEETTHVLEDVIRQRIKDKVFDDVERKEKPVETPIEFKKKLMLDQEKSKESLAQIYEKEFVQQREALNPDAAEKEEEEPQLHQEIKTLMYSLFTKLDALSNFHFTPKPAAPELKVVSNLPAINMEEVAPVAASDATLLAPEEIKLKTKGDAIGKSERTDTDKKRERRNKRQRQREHAKEKKRKENAVSKMNPGLGNKYSKEKAKKMLERVTKETNVDKMDESQNIKSVKSSTAFFTELEEEVRLQIKNKVKSSNTNSKKIMNAKKMKL